MLLGWACVYETGLVGKGTGADSCDEVVWFADADGDAFGDASVVIAACEATDGWVADATDCDDADDAVHPDAAEVCNDVDDDCDGLIDGQDDPVDGASTWYADADGDGLGDPGVSESACGPGAGWVDNALDCDDSDASVGACGSSQEDDGAICPDFWGTDDGLPEPWTGTCDAGLGFEAYGGHCYFPVETYTIWEDARASCAAAGGYLATLADSAEEAFVFSHVPGMYIGGCQEEDEGAWVWITGETMDWEHWQSGEPNDSSPGEDCLEVWDYGSPYWNDIHCDQRWEALGYVCEFG